MGLLLWQIELIGRLLTAADGFHCLASELNRPVNKRELRLNPSTRSWFSSRVLRSNSPCLVMMRREVTANSV